VQPEWIGGFSIDLSDLANRVRLEAETYRTSNLTDSAGNLRLDFVKTLNALKYINTIVSPALRQWAPPDIQDNHDAQRIMTAGVGICGQQVEAYMGLMDAIGIHTRMIQICTRKGGNIGSHVACEAFVEDKWRYIDVSFASVASSSDSIYDLLSLEEIIAEEKDYTVLRSEFDPWTYHWIRNFGDPVREIAKCDQFEIIIDGAGTMFVPFHQGRADFTGIPNFAGPHLRSMGREGNLSLAFLADDRRGLEIEFGPASYYTDQEGQLIVRDASRQLLDCKVAQNLGKVRFESVEGALIVSVAASNYCSVVINSVTYI
jgi:hypothetical protein